MIVPVRVFLVVFVLAFAATPLAIRTVQAAGLGERVAAPLTPEMLASSRCAGGAERQRFRAAWAEFRTPAGPASPAAAVAGATP